MDKEEAKDSYREVARQLEGFHEVCLLSKILLGLRSLTFLDSATFGLLTYVTVL